MLFGRISCIFTAHSKIQSSKYNKKRNNKYILDFNSSQHKLINDSSLVILMSHHQSLCLLIPDFMKSCISVCLYASRPPSILFTVWLPQYHTSLHATEINRSSWETSTTPPLNSCRAVARPRVRKNLMKILENSKKSPHFFENSVKFRNYFQLSRN